ncbi:unnamed protein product [Caenorhabditis angaria]|uniref:NR LBD domain-containing protein n=1 Tax=Caenorhabditis angaria TaxID=860376 RepID=A0A9P1NB31_9PELO|nr:unnamed protein product [Caenorhabditis angaria]
MVKEEKEEEKREGNEEPVRKRSRLLSSPRRKNGITCQDLEELAEQINTLCNTIIQNALSDLTIQTKLTVEDLVIEHSSPTFSKLQYQLNAAELRALDQVKDICEEMDLENDKYLESFSKEEKTPSDILNLIEIVMQRCIRIAKKIMTVRGAELYNWETISFDTPTVKNASVDIQQMFSKLNDCSSCSKQQGRCLEFFDFLDLEVRSNKLAMKIFTLAVLFTVREMEKPNEKDEEIIITQHNHYLGLLRRYLESLYGDDAHKIFDKIPDALEMLKEIAKGSAALFVGMKRKNDNQPLSNEIFGIQT